MVDHYEARALPPGRKLRIMSNGRKTVIIGIFISISLFISQLFSILGTPRPSFTSVARNYQEHLSLNEIREKPSCFKNYLGMEPPPIKPTGSCHLINPPRGYCSTLQRLFANKPENCTRKSVTFCSDDPKEEVRCALPDECRGKPVYIGTFDASSMRTIWLLVSAEGIQTAVNTLRSKPSSKGYVFVACALLANLTKLISITDFEHAQLVVFPQQRPPSVRSPVSSFPNVHFLMLDSVSRPHLYRSLPHTVKVLESLRAKRRTDVYDFAFLQAITQGTYESLEGMFTGYINTTAGTDRYLRIGKLFAKLKRKGYSIHWLEDSCWRRKQGLATFFPPDKGTADDILLQRFERYLQHGSIDDAKFSFVSCDIRTAIGNGTRDNASLCFNGKHFHEYLLEHASSLQRAGQQMARPTLTFTHLTTGRDYPGTRIQTVDAHLADHLRDLATLENTVTILFSNHGNTNGMLVETSFEGYIEAFNPFLFVVLPARVKAQLPPADLRHLRENEQRLASLLDLHGFLLRLMLEQEEEDTIPRDFRDQFTFQHGLLSGIPHSRSCHDVPLILPNLCICREFEALAQPSSVHAALADFGVGALNNAILHQRFGSGIRGFGTCEILMPAGIRIAHERRIAADTIRYKLDVDVYPTANGAGQRGVKEIFFFTIEVTEASEPGVRLLSYERLSAYDVYSSCCDLRVDLRLCVCNVPNQTAELPIKQFYFLPKSISALVLQSPSDGHLFMGRVQNFLHHRLPMDGRTSTELRYPARKPCLFAVRHSYSGGGFCLYAYSVCSRVHRVLLHTTAVDYRLSLPKRSTHLLHYSELKCLVCGVSHKTDAASIVYSFEVIPF